MTTVLLERTLLSNYDYPPDPVKCSKHSLTELIHCDDIEKCALDSRYSHLKLTDPSWLANRKIKFRKMVAAGEYEVLIYADCNLDILELDSLVENFVKSKASIGFGVHPDREDCEQEINFAYRLSKISKSEVFSYKKFVDNNFGLYQKISLNSLILRKPDTDVDSAFSGIIEIMRHSVKRDQILLRPLLDKLDISYFLFDHKEYGLVTKRHKQSIYFKLKKKFNYIIRG